MGAGKWRDDFGPIFDGADVVICGDNDQPGRDHVALVAKNLHGVARRVRVLELKSFWPEIEESDDITDWFEAGHSVEQLWSFVDQVDDWHPSTNGQDDAAPPWEEPPPADENDHGETQPLPFINISEWDSEPVPTRQWAVADRIPLRQPTLFSGEGAIGKTLIALQLSVAHVTARDWLKTIPEPGSVIYVGAEDDTDELHRRLADICAHYNVRFADLTGNLHLLSFAGKDALLGIAGRDGIVKATSLFERLHRAARDKQPKLIVLDTVSDIFVGNENDRAQVRQFVALLRRLAIDTNAAVLVLSHPSLTGINSGTGLSGSTGWHNSVRARMYLKVAATEDGEEPAPELRELQFMKNNYGPLAERILLRWRNGVFVPEPGTGSLEKAAAEAKAENAFLDILARFNRQERNVSDKSGPTFAPALFAQEAEAKTTRIRKPALVDAMRRLFAANRIHLETYGKPSRPFKRLVPGAQP
jgi:RecA-family ATPase